MTHIGDFGKPQSAIAEKAELDTIGVGFPAISIRLKPADRTPAFFMAEFARLIAVGLPPKDMTTMSTCYGVLEACILPDDFGTFRNASGTLDDAGMVDLVFALYERWSKVPLGGTQGSSDGVSSNQEKPSESSSRPSKRAKRRTRSETPEEAQARLEAVVLGTSSDNSPQTSSTQ